MLHDNNLIEMSLRLNRTEPLFRTSYIFTLNILDKKLDHIISEALSDIQAYEPSHEKCQTFSLTFHFLTPKERDLHCSHDIMLRTKQTYTYTFYPKSFSFTHTITTTSPQISIHQFQIQLTVFPKLHVLQ